MTDIINTKASAENFIAEIGPQSAMYQMEYSVLRDCLTNFANNILNAQKTIPIDMVLLCPKCHRKHIDKPDPLSCKNCGRLISSHGKEENILPCDTPEPWINGPHKKHRCLDCGHVWKPANVPTNGVAKLL
jgi:hypothetical protein